MLDALLWGVERALHVEDGSPMLDGDDASGGEGATIPDPVNLVEDGHGRIAWAQEVGVQRVHLAVLDGSPCRHQRLARHLATEDALALLVGLDAAEDVDLDWLEVEQVDEEVEGFAHPPILPPRQVACAEAVRDIGSRP